jgi:hypothetical protein
MATHTRARKDKDKHTESCSAASSTELGVMVSRTLEGACGLYEGVQRSHIPSCMQISVVRFQGWRSGR